MSNSFTAHLWQAIQLIYQQILAHPFNQELAAGTLSRERFQFYLQQDALYLTDFARALGLIGARSERSEQVVSFLNFALGAIVAERSLHESYFRLYEIQPEITYAPTCFTYTRSLLATAALDPYEVAIAAVLPCFWIYREVGSEIYRMAQPHNPYQQWIDTYAGEEFAQVVQQAIDITESVAEQTTAALRDKMMAAFVTASRLEWLFWDSAYRLESWQPE
ncbi:thiaminase II [Synechococcus sp. Nb3U1]|uniref:thiaminase II n=1 Tax=Synechococcus sp. Nb3U1 TaxID=1914529 RepID=UPI001F37111B|nr:thiaminase II [Synechococcus sp. Nb3U1]MCF2970072.1 thiaminase II [Synechococcus sp. Nb3U1]